MDKAVKDLKNDLDVTKELKGAADDVNKSVKSVADELHAAGKDIEAETKEIREETMKK